MKKRILSLLLALVMVVTLLPTVAIATEVDTGTDGGLTGSENIDAPPPVDNTGGDIKNLEQLTNAFANGGAYQLKNNIIVTSSLILPADKELSINGNGYVIRPTVTGLNEQGIVNDNASDIDNIIYNNGTLTLSNLMVYGGEGRCIANSGTLTMNGVSLERAHLTSDYGAGIRNNSTGVIVMTDSIIRRNGCDSAGGGFFNSSGTIIMENCSIVENRNFGSSTGGGAGENNRGYLYLNNCTVANNQSSEIGGGINNYGGTIYVMNSTFTGNVTTSTSYGGGAIGVNGGSLYAVNSIFALNYTYNKNTPSNSDDINRRSGTVNLYNCAYGALVGSSITTQNCTAGITAIDFPATFESGSLNQNGAETETAYIRPVVVTLSNKLYGVPVNSLSNVSGVATYYERDGATVKMSFDSNGTNTQLGNLPTTTVPANICQDNSTRVSNCVGALSYDVSTTKYYTVKVNVACDTTGTDVPDSGKVLGASAYGDSYVAGSRVEITASPNSGYKFHGWKVNGDEVTSHANPYVISSITSDIVMTPVFATGTVFCKEPTVVDTYSYTGEEQIVVLDGFYEEFMTITQGNKGTAVGDYTVIITLADGYGWEYGSDGQVPWSIGSAEEYTVTANAFPEAGGTVSGAGDYVKGATATLAATPAAGYRFVNWTKGGEVVSTNAIYSITADTDVTLIANFELNSYTITATANPAGGGSVEGGGTYNHGTEVTLTATPAAGYKFVKWTKGGIEVGTDATYTFAAEASCTLVANFERDTYTIKFVNADGTELQSSEVAYGETPAYTGETPTKAGNAQYTHTFDGWSPAIEAVSGEATYTATYTSTVNEYTIKFVNADGTELQSSKVAYGETPAYTGETPTKAGNAQYTYTFDKWSPEIAPVTGEATYTAQFSTTVNKYTVTFYAEDGTTVLESKEWEYGQNPVYNNGQNPTKPATAEKSYTFAGWTPAVVTVSGNASYTATFTDATNTYTVTWYNEDGTTVLETATWAYGSVPSFTKPTPAKAADAENTYAFKEWVAMSGLDSDGKVTGDASFKASYTATKIDYTGTVSPEEGTMENVTAGGLGEVAEEINKNIVLTVKVEAADANDTEQTAIKGQAGSRTLEFLDITLKDDGGNSVEVPQSTVLEIAIPFTVGNKQNITVYRHHNGTAAAFTALNTKPAADARTDATFYVDSANNCIYVYTNQFSTYAIGYTVPSSATAGSYTPTYAIAVEKSENGTVKANRTYTSSGSTVTITATPKDGYVVDTVSVTDSQGNKIEVTVKSDGTYTFKMPSRKVTVEATFVSDGSYATCTGDSSCPMYGYTDLDCGAWYHDGVHYAIDNGLMSGYGNGIFKPNADTTRAMITVMLWRLNGSPVVNYALDFEDVEEGKWYTEAIRWAKSEGIAGGYGNGYFGTNDAITREQMVTILWRYAQQKNVDVSVGENTNILSFEDAFDVAEYAIPAVQWACGSGVIGGKNNADGTGLILDPEGKGTRAQIATMMMRFCEEIAK